MDFESFVLAAATADLADATDPVAVEYADAVEFRMDLAEEPLAALSTYDGDLPIIATNRVEWEGGEAPDEQTRLDRLERAAEHPSVKAVDIELEAIRRGDAEVLLDRIDTSVIVSTHDFDRTPSAEDMRSLLSEATEHGDVGKLAVTTEDVRDVPPLLAVTRECTVRGLSVATMAMGEPGRHSRAVAPVYGSSIGYAPVDPTNATAPGQFDLATLADLVARLNPPEASIER